MQENNRKKDAHRKIMMGGLVIKAGLGNLQGTEDSVILGILVDGANNLLSDLDGSKKEYYKSIGEKAFGES